MDQRLKSALDKLEHGGWSLTVAGFARRALKMAAPMSVTNRRAARGQMIELLGEPRTVLVRALDGDQMLEVWDHQK